MDEIQTKVILASIHDHEASENNSAFSDDENTAEGEMLETSVMITKLMLICFPANPLS